MNNYKLASHDSMTYLKPVKWYQRMFNFLAKCQNKDLADQAKAGVELFDMRIVWVKDQFKFAHGLSKYNEDVLDTIMRIDSYAQAAGKRIVIRLILEEAWDDHTQKNEFNFKWFCKTIEAAYTNIDFCGGYRKWDWTRIYKFNSDIEEEDIDQNHSSYVSDKGKRTWCFIPWLYAKLMNKKILKKGTDKKYLMIDFI